MCKSSVFKFPKTASNAAANYKGTNSRVGKTYPKCKPGVLCSEEYVCDTITKCGNCKKIKAL
jgi:hypothetical protein